VYLTGFDQPFVVCAYGGAEQPEVLPHPVRVVPPVIAQIQTGPDPFAHAPKAGGKAVGDSAGPVKGIAGEEGYTLYRFQGNVHNTDLQTCGEITTTYFIIKMYGWQGI
jgi:hypothetical protein